MSIWTFRPCPCIEKEGNPAFPKRKQTGKGDYFASHSMSWGWILLISTSLLQNSGKNNLLITICNYDAYTRFFCGAFCVSDIMQWEYSQTLFIALPSGVVEGGNWGGFAKAIAQFFVRWWPENCANRSPVHRPILAWFLVMLGGTWEYLWWNSTSRAKD